MATRAPDAVDDSPEVAIIRAEPAPASTHPEKSSWRSSITAPSVAAPMLAGSTVVVAASHEVHALAFETGAPLWSARVTSSPWTVRHVTPAGSLVIVAVGLNASETSQPTDLVALDAMDRLAQ